MREDLMRSVRGDIARVGRMNTMKEIEGPRNVNMAGNASILNLATIRHAVLRAVAK